MQKCLLSLAILLFACSLTLAQVRGTIRSASDNSPLPGTSVVVKGSSTGVTADGDGSYSISAKDGDVLVFSFIGYAVQEVTVGTKTVIDVILQEDATQMNEVVVTALGIEKDRIALGYAVSSIKSEDLVRTGNPTNPLESLYGKASGVQIMGTSGGPTGAMVIKVRNAMTFTQQTSTRPLFVVDGVPIHDENSSVNGPWAGQRDRGTGINDINPQDIESIEILKGAKAAILYGSLAANGVVLITTKSGKEKRGLGIELNTNISTDRVAYFPTFQNEYGSGNGMASSGLSRDSFSDDGFLLVDGEKSFWNGASGSFGPRMDGQLITWWDGQKRTYSAQPDNFKDLFVRGSQSSTNLAFSNSGNVGSFRASYTFKDFNGTYVGAEQQNHDFSFNGQLKASDKVSVKYISNFFYVKNTNALQRIDNLFTYGMRRDERTDMYRGSNLVDEEGYNRFAMNPSLSERVGFMNAVSGYYWNQTQNQDVQQRYHTVQSLSVNVDITKWLSWNTLAGVDLTMMDTEVKNRQSRPLRLNPNQGYYEVTQRRIASAYGQSYLNYNFNFGEDWELSGLAGFSMRKVADRTSGQYIQDSFFTDNKFSLTNTKLLTGPLNKYARGYDDLYSVLGSAQIAWRNQVFVEVQGRNDWSSILPPDNNKYFYPGVSAAWVFSETVQLPEIFNQAKVRASWADAGRPGPRYFGNMSFQSSAYGGVPYLNAPNELPPGDFAGSAGFPTPNLKPERKRETEIGLEFSMLESRLGFEFSAFRSNTYNQIMAITTPQSSGVTAVRINAGDIQNNGWELLLRGTPVKTSDFQWDASMTLAGYQTKINSLDKGIKEYNLWGATGVRVSAVEGGEYGTVSVRPFKRDANGNYLIGNNGLRVIDKENWKKVGSVVPNVIGGLNTSLRYKNFDLNASFDYQFGAILPSQTNQFLIGNGTGKETLQYRDEANGGLPYYVNSNGQYVQLPSHQAAVPADSRYNIIFHDGVLTDGVNETTQEKNAQVIPSSVYYSQYWQGDQTIFEDRVFKSDFISFRKLAIGWNAPSSFASRLHMNSLRVYLYANNIAYLYKAIPNISPETLDGSNSFGENNGLPLNRSFGAGLNLSF